MYSTNQGLGPQTSFGNRVPSAPESPTGQGEGNTPNAFSTPQQIDEPPPYAPNASIEQQASAPPQYNQAMGTQIINQPQPQPQLQAQPQAQGQYQVQFQGQAGAVQLVPVQMAMINGQMVPVQPVSYNVAMQQPVQLTAQPMVQGVMPQQVMGRPDQSVFYTRGSRLPLNGSNSHPVVNINQDMAPTGVQLGIFFVL